ncbi:hypothetical protein NDU88_005867 [Pleurodeles waltl]|uniref:Uncharacterized protein n=1 Tax=Pleurodeles waltl TaxID=8319 RepID=A0AAV7VN24_PLEWA|nr:hypothetical protein NDU88_005867 [Pleurodeles waltl]
MKFALRSGASIRQRMVSRGRNAAGSGAVVVDDRMGGDFVRAQASVAARVIAEPVKQAPLPSEIACNGGEGFLVERTLAMGPKMAALIADLQDPIIVLSDMEGDDRVFLHNFGGASQAKRVALTSKALVKDMGVQAGLAGKDDLVNKDSTFEEVSLMSLCMSWLFYGAFRVSELLGLKGPGGKITDRLDVRLSEVKADDSLVMSAVTSGARTVALRRAEYVPL